MTLTDSIISFIEETMMKYGFEDSLIKDDPLLEKELSEVKNLYERFAIKFVFGEKINNQIRTGKSLEDILPSMKLKRILEKLINKKISYTDLQVLIKKELDTTDTIAKEISKSIENNPKITEALNNQATDNDQDQEPEEDDVAEQKIENKKSIGFELLK